MLYRIYGYSYYKGYMDIQDIWIYMYILYFTGCMDIHIIQGIWIYILYRIYGYEYYKGYIDIHVVQDICGYTCYTGFMDIQVHIIQDICILHFKQDICTVYTY